MGCILCVPQDNVYVVEQCGKFSHVAHPGISFATPCITSWSSISTRIEKLDLKVETKTKDNVFVNIDIWIQYVVKLDKVYEAHYKLDSPIVQIGNYIFDVVRSTVPLQTLDEVFESKDEIAHAVRDQLKNTMDGFGYDIVKTLITDIVPNSKVVDAMNEINSSKRDRLASQEQAEADKLRAVKMAEAQAEAMFLQGQGVARQRKAILDGLQESVSDFSHALKDINPKEALDLVLLTQYFDTLKELGSSSSKQTIFIPHNPGSLSTLAQEINEGILH